MVKIDNEQERATILAALRHHQQWIEQCENNGGLAGGAAIGRRCEQISTDDSAGEVPNIPLIRFAREALAILEKHGNTYCDIEDWSNEALGKVGMLAISLGLAEDNRAAGFRRTGTSAAPATDKEAQS
jgi:hypothetical protein